MINTLSTFVTKLPVSLQELNNGSDIYINFSNGNARGAITQDYLRRNPMKENSMFIGPVITFTDQTIKKNSSVSRYS
jgi:hypothetical protein